MYKSFIHGLLLPIVLSLASCAVEETDPVLDGFNGVSVEISPSDSVSIGRFGIMMPKSAIKYGEWFIVQKSRGGNFIDLVNPGSGEVIHIADMGRGPEELTVLSSFQRCGSYLHLYDANQMKYMSVDIDGTIKDRTQHIGHRTQFIFAKASADKVERPSELYRCADGFLSIGLWGDNLWYRLISADGVPGYGVTQVEFESLENLNELEKSAFYRSSVMSVSPSGDKVAVASSSAAAISSGRIVGNRLEEIAHIGLGNPEVFPVRSPNMPLLRYGDSSTDTFCGAYASDDLIYLLYSGKKIKGADPAYICNYLLVYDWSLNPVIAVRLSEGICSINVEDGMLYGVSPYPEPVIYRYNLNEALRTQR